MCISKFKTGLGIERRKEFATCWLTMANLVVGWNEMSKLYNTPFETSLRMLLLLESANKQGFSVDMMTGIDFIAIYGKDFDQPLKKSTWRQSIQI